MHPHSYARYTGSAPMPYMPGAMFPGMHQHGAPGHGFCHGCGHPKSKCVCNCCECRKEAKELLVLSNIQRGDLTNTPGFNTAAKTQHIAPMIMTLAPTQDTAAFKDATALDRQNLPGLAAAAGAVQLGIGAAFIGGGCCVHLSIEYTPTNPAVQSLVGVLVQDSEGTLLAWIRTEKPGVGYQIKECIVTTKPGATMVVLTINMTARVRWCEVFSCC
jgi:hypothetical protein